MKEANRTKKFIVLGVLFILPLTAYMFFASGVNNFLRLPILSENISEISAFQTLDSEQVQLQNKITILGFFGSNLEENKAYAYNLAHKIYKKNHQFTDFQFVILLPENAREQAEVLDRKLSEIESTSSWHFAFGSDEEIENVFKSLNSPYTLNETLTSPYVFIIDKERSLRGRSDDDDTKDGKLYGYDSRTIAEINNKMSDDVKGILAEYRLALKKNKNASRKI